MKIVAVKKDEKGTIHMYKLDNGQVITQQDAVQMVQNKEIDNCNISTARNGTHSIRSNNDGDPSNNLDNLPSF